ncbi:MAG: hypothetical protein J5803_00935 [Desulfovibrio sp.]|nr:hypothetical protein [Desulfovibrio sp.]
MNYPHYIASAIDGRIRLRDPLLKTDEGKARVTAILKKQKKVREIREGASSLLIFFDPEMKITTLCTALEKELPEWRKGAKPTRSAQSTPSFDAVKIMQGLNGRKLELRFLLATLGIGALLGLVGSGKAHTAFSLIATLYTMRHVWMRRSAL